jgi:pimeloyl-ACP methyl ester carboxylesterase
MADQFTSAAIRIESLYRNRPILLVGYSLGAAIALHVADLHRRDAFPHGILLLAPFYSALSVVLAHSYTSLMLAPAYYPLDALVARTPVLRQNHRICIAHGGSDEVVSVAHGRMLASIAFRVNRSRSRYVEIPDASHLTIRLEASVYEDARSLFFEAAQ